MIWKFLWPIHNFYVTCFGLAHVLWTIVWVPWQAGTFFISGKFTSPESSHYHLQVITGTEIANSNMLLNHPYLPICLHFSQITYFRSKKQLFFVRQCRCSMIPKAKMKFCLCISFICMFSIVFIWSADTVLPMFWTVHNWAMPRLWTSSCGLSFPC